MDPLGRDGVGGGGFRVEADTARLVTNTVSFVVCIMPETMLTSTLLQGRRRVLAKPSFLFGPDCEGPTAKAVGTGLGLGGGMRGPFGRLIDTLATNTFYAGAVREFHFDEHPRPLDEFAEQISAALTNMQHLTGVYSIWTEQASFIVEATFPSLVECQIPWSYDDTPEFLLRHPQLRKIDMCYEEFGIRYPGKYALPNLVEFQGVDALAPALLGDARNLQRLRLRLDMEFEQDPAPIFRMLARNECPLWLVDITMYRWDERVLSAVPLHGQHITSLVLRNEGDDNDNDIEADRVFMSGIDQIIHLLPNLFFIRIESLTSFNLQDASLQHQLAFEVERAETWRRSTPTLGICSMPSEACWMYLSRRWFPQARDPRRIWQIMQAMTRGLGEGEKSALMTLHVLALAELTRPEKYEFVKKMGAVQEHLALM
ncbi:hypothetical protein HMN09_01003700 [Mycena chlorophos]|uniref:Uncharacterized protein n=1 Tax=Mycena chlorophos TaxID=658473 RepID=A0A8H6W344_MYCCL|nr:hypothetical protein HMN09_01003700 [Mycena chlorophos]